MALLYNPTRRKVKARVMSNPEICKKLRCTTFILAFGDLQPGSYSPTFRPINLSEGNASNVGRKFQVI